MLSTRGLQPEDFPDYEAAWKAADQTLEEMNEEMPELRLEHPDGIYAGMPQLDQLWFRECKGSACRRASKSLLPFVSIALFLRPLCSNAHKAMRWTSLSGMTKA